MRYSDKIKNALSEENVASDVRENEFVNVPLSELGPFDYWKTRYIWLLEKYNDLLSKQAGSSGPL
jgi:hypothetical protein